MDHIVEYYESERGWGGEIWYRRYNSKQEADAAIKDCNGALPRGDVVPDYYIRASYVGVDTENNPKYDKVYKH